MVEQVDRDAAADFLKSRMDHKCSAGLDCLYSDQISRGGADWHVLVKAFAAHRIAAEARGKEAAARIIQKRMDKRFEEHGTREWDTNACYYQGSAAETYEALDEEAEELITAIRASIGQEHSSEVERLRLALEDIQSEMAFPNSLESGFVHHGPTLADMQKRVELAKQIAAAALNGGQHE